MRRWYRAPVFLALVASLATPALAQTSTKSTAQSSQSSGFSGIGYRGWGVQVGVSSSPDQFYGGFHWDLGEFAKNVRFRPVLEVGVGDHATLVQAMAEVTYIFSKVQVWKPYVGGELGMTYVDVSNLPPGADNTDTALALMAVGGIETKLKSGAKVFFDLRVGIGDDDPDAKLGVGWTWK